MINLQHQSALQSGSGDRPLPAGQQLQQRERRQRQRYRRPPAAQAVRRHTGLAEPAPQPTLLSPARHLLRAHHHTHRVQALALRPVAAAAASTLQLLVLEPSLPVHQESDAATRNTQDRADHAGRRQRDWATRVGHRRGGWRERTGE